MELKELVEETIKIFEINDIYELKEKLKDVTLNNKYEYYSKFKNLVVDLSIDWMQKIFQYYESDRIEKKQDYTPKCLSKLVSVLTNDNEEKMCTDLCCGSGALTIQKWNQNKNINFICKEFDENVIPFLLFNLAIRNINANVYQMDVLQNEVFKEYKVTSQDLFSRIEVV